MNTSKAWTITAITLAWLWLLPVLHADEHIYRGKWDGNPIEIRLKVNEVSGTVAGVVYKPGDPQQVYATMKGKRRADGSMEVQLTYRFDDFGTFILKPGASDSAPLWETSGRDLWFEQSG